MPGVPNYASAGLGVIGGIVGMIGDLTHSAMPTYQPVDLSAETSKTIGMNQSNAPAAQQLTDTTNVFNQQQTLKMLNMAIPDYQRLMQEELGVIEPGMQGQLPQGVLDQIRNQSAAYGVSSGVTSRSQFAGYRGLRQLGINSLAYAQQSVNSARAWLAQAEQMTKAPQMNLASMWVSPMEGATFAAQQHELQFQNTLSKWAQPNALQLAGKDIAGIGGALSGASTGYDMPTYKSSFGSNDGGLGNDESSAGGAGSGNMDLTNTDF